MLERKGKIGAGSFVSGETVDSFLETTPSLLGLPGRISTKIRACVSFSTRFPHILMPPCRQSASRSQLTDKKKKPRKKRGGIRSIVSVCVKVFWNQIDDASAKGA